MPVLSLTNMRMLEGNSSYDYMTFRVSLDAPSSAPVSFAWFTMDGSASAGGGDYGAEGPRTVTIPAGQTHADLRIAVYGDRTIEPDETFHVAIHAVQNATLANGAALLVATGTILDDDDGLPSGSPGAAGPATPYYGSGPQAGPLPTLTVFNTRIVEGDSSYEYATFVVLLDRPATADVTVQYYLQGGTAHAQAGDFGDGSGTLTIPAGRQAGTVRVPVYGDTRAEGHETFSLVLANVRNAVFAGGAAALRATGTILDNDSGLDGLTGGIGVEAARIPGPDAAGPGPLPTLRAHDVSILEGNSSFEYARILVTLDRPASAPVTLSWHTQDGTASSAQGDYGETSGTLTIAAGQQSAWVNVAVYGDQRIEGDESFSVVFNAIRNGRFEHDAPALEAVVRIVEDDMGAPSQPAGIGAPARGVAAPVSTAALMPVLQVHDAAKIEGASSYDYMQFLVTLDRPAAAPVSFRYATLDGTASQALGDYGATSGSATIPAGEQSMSIRVPIYGDSLAEGDESFSLLLYGVSNANFAGNVPALVARGTIVDDDGGAISRPGGRGDPAAGALGPLPAADAVRIAPVPVSVIEGNSSYATHYIPILLSEPARGEIRINWETRDTGSATAGEDFQRTSGVLTIPAGSSSGVIGVQVYGDTRIEGDETFVLALTTASGALFANGRNGIETEIRIVDNETGGTGADPGFRLTNGASNGPDQLTGTPLADAIAGGAGNDTIFGFEGHDTLDGGAGDDLIFGGAGNDWLAGGAGNDTLHGGDGADTINGGAGDDFLYGGDTEADLRDVIYGGDGDDWIDGGAGNDELWGGEGNDTIVGGLGSDTLIGNGGADVLSGAGGSDEIHGGAGDDWINGGFGFDRLNGGAGADTFFHQGVADHGSDWIQDYRFAEGDVLAVGIAGATRAQFQVNFANTPGAGAADVAEAFVIHRPTGQILFALVDGAAQDSIMLQASGQSWDLLA